MIVKFEKKGKAIRRALLIRHSYKPEEESCIFRITEEGMT